MLHSSPPSLRAYVPSCLGCSKLGSPYQTGGISWYGIWYDFSHCPPERFLSATVLRRVPKAWDAPYGGGSMRKSANARQPATWQPSSSSQAASASLQFQHVQ